MDDVDYLRKLINEVTREGLPIDAERIYLMRMSNGGEMGQRAAKAAGHAWPNLSPTTYEHASEAKNGFKNQDINAEEVLWASFKKQKRVAGSTELGHVY